MVWPIMRGKSYVGETGKSMKVMELTVVLKTAGVTSPLHSLTRIVSVKGEIFVGLRQCPVGVGLD
jgi:hypothetical protein